MNPTIVKLAAQALVGRRRGLVLLILPLLLVGLAVLLRALSGNQAYTGVVSGLGVGLALPLVALLATSAVLGPEIDDGSIVYLLAKPVNRYVVGLSKYVVALAATIVCGALPVLPTGLILDPDRVGASMAWFVGGVLASGVYCALFLALCAVTRHAVVVGLLFVLLWEGLFGGLFAGIRWASPLAWASQLAHDIDTSISLPADVGLTYALVASGVVMAAGIWLTGDRLRSFSLRGED